jgi:ubiquinol-cytochrome c reductase cytochrome b subunit
VDQIRVPGPPPSPPPGRVRVALRRWGNTALGVSLFAAALRQRRARRRGDERTKD